MMSYSNNMDALTHSFTSKKMFWSDETIDMHMCFAQLDFTVAMN